MIDINRRGMLGLTAATGLSTLIPDGVLQAAEPARLTGAFPQRALLKADLSGLLDLRNQAKPVLDRMMIDDMEQNGHWFASDTVALTYTAERAKSGSRSMRFATDLRNEAYIRAARAPNGSFNGQGVLFAGTPFSAFIAKRLSPAQDWSRFNRISLWCYLHPTDNPINSLSLQFLCDGASAGPQDPVSVHYFGDLRPGEWNHLVWEIPEIQRDKVSQIILFQSVSGIGIASAQPRITYDVDQLAVERVEAERVEGWSVTPGKLAYSHIGYQAGAQKIAVADGAVAADHFTLLDAQSGKEVAHFPTRALTNHRGHFSLLDFSAHARPGTYRLRHGPVTSAPFAVSDQAWRPLIEAVLNAFYGLRCGFAVAGVHDACHLDVYAEYQGERRVVGGGWHDAANMTQGPYRTHLSIYALIELHEAMLRQGDAALAERALEEARWGLEWSLRCRFGPGVRVLYGEYSYWTDSKPGTIDDVVQDDPRSRVGRDAYQNTLAALATARAGRLLRAKDPKLARLLLRAAAEDYADVAGSITVPTDATPREINEPSWRDQIGYLTLAATELYRATGEAPYATDAARFARWLIQTQERRFVAGIPITGYFYEDAGRTRIVHEYHNSFEDCGLLAFAALCDTLPNHADWIDWYAGLALYADHFCQKGSETAAPFDVIPAAVWRRADLDAPLPPDETGQRLAKAGATPVFPTAPTPDLIKAQMLNMYEAGTKLGPDHALRIFPLWSDHIRHGATTVHMSKTIGLGVAAQAMGRADLSDLAARQVQWTVGANPLSRSLIYGVGHDFWQNFTAALPNFVGGMSLGFNSYRDDAPAWGNNAVFPYKEMWVYSTCRMALNLARVGVPARLTVQTTRAADLRNLRDGSVTRIAAGRSTHNLPAGTYELRQGAQVRPLTLAHAAERQLDLDRALTMTLDVTQSQGATITLRLALHGRGHHDLAARMFNGHLSGLPDSVHLEEGKPMTLDLSLVAADTDMPWLLTIIPDGRLADRAECSGAARALLPMG